MSKSNDSNNNKNNNNILVDERKKLIFTQMKQRIGVSGNVRSQI